LPRIFTGGAGASPSQWTSWLNAAIPALEDSSTLLAADATTPIARLQQQRLQARIASVLTDDDYGASLATACVSARCRWC
jgi:hypothetical protein